MFLTRSHRNLLWPHQHCLNIEDWNLTSLKTTSEFLSNLHRDEHAMTNLRQDMATSRNLRSIDILWMNLRRRLDYLVDLIVVTLFHSRDMLVDSDYFFYHDHRIEQSNPVVHRYWSYLHRIHSKYSFVDCYCCFLHYKYDLSQLETIRSICSFDP